MMFRFLARFLILLARFLARFTDLRVFTLCQTMTACHGRAIARSAVHSTGEIGFTILIPQISSLRCGRKPVAGTFGCF